MAKVSTLKAEAAKRAAREAADKAAAVTNLDPASLSWEEYKKAANAKRGGGTVPDRIMAKWRADWNAANPTPETIPSALPGTGPKPQLNPNTGFTPIGKGGDISSQPHVGETPGTVEDFAATLKGARKELKAMSDADRLALANKLIDAGFPAPKVGIYTDQLLSNYQSAISAAQGAYKLNKEFPTISTFLADRQKQQAAIAAAGGGTGTKGSNYTDTTVFNPTQAISYINSEFKQFLGIDATSKEISILTKQLQDAQRKNPQRVTTDANGNKVTTGGLDAQGFLDSAIKKTPEFVKKLEGKAAASTENLLATARDNGINASQSQIDSWNKRIQNGEDIATIQHEIRGMAAIGRPDTIAKQLSAGHDLSTILSPYKSYMQQILEVPADQISMTDPTLQMAIAGDKPMNLYDYQNALRKDNRWQYTQNAKTDVANSVQQVLKDFGFMG